MKEVRWMLGALLLIVLTVVPVWAGAPTDQVKQYTDQVAKILQDPAIRQLDKRDAVRKVAEQIFDVNETAKRALGPHWQTDRKSTRLNSSHIQKSRMPSSA